jgi:hypothetical protein
MKLTKFKPARFTPKHPYHRMTILVEEAMSRINRYGRIVAALTLLAVLAGCVVEPVYVGPPHRHYYYGGYYYR